MKKLLLISLCIALAFSCTPTPEQGKKEVIKSCVEAANNMPEYIGISKSKIQKYCECYADEVIDNSGFSIKEMEEMTLSEIENMASEAALNCVDILLD